MPLFLLTHITYFKDGKNPEFFRPLFNPLGEIQAPDALTALEIGKRDFPRLRSHLAVEEVREGQRRVLQ